MDPRRRGDYQGVSELGGTLGRFWAPAAYGFLAMEWGALGWLTIAVIVVLAATGCTRRRTRAGAGSRSTSRPTSSPTPGPTAPRGGGRPRRAAHDAGARRSPARIHR